MTYSSHGDDAAKPEAQCNRPQADLSLPTIEEVLRDPATSIWLRQSLSSALQRDPVDAANDAEILALLLARRCQTILETA
jgi:hypothetical protein